MPSALSQNAPVRVFKRITANGPVIYANKPRNTLHLHGSHEILRKHFMIPIKVALTIPIQRTSYPAFTRSKGSKMFQATQTYS